MVNPGGRTVQLLDCTLRDGGYYTNWDFDERLVEQYFQTMNSLPIDYIEIGYRSKPKQSYKGGYYYLPKYLLDKCRNRTSKKLAIIINEKEVLVEEIVELLKPCIGIIEMVRLAVAPENLERAIRCAEVVKEQGFLISLNLMYASKWEEKLYVSESFKYLNGVLDYFYVVDSYGGMTPNEVTNIFNKLKEKLSVDLGFHGHNNIEMALINSLAAIDAGAVLVDATVCGMGRGAGNLKTELLLSILHRKYEVPVDFDILNELVESFLDLKERYKWGTNLPYMLSGAFSLPQNTVLGRVKKRFFSLNSIVRGVSSTSSPTVGDFDFPVFSPVKNFAKVMVVGGGSTPQEFAGAIKEYLKENSEICVIHSSSRNLKIFLNLPNHQFHCLSGKEIHRLEKKLHSGDRSKRIFLISPQAGETIQDGFSSKFEGLFEVLEKGFFQEKYDLSTTAMAMDIASCLNVQEVMFIGYDGYTGRVSPEQMELFEENQEIFNEAKRKGLMVFSLTPSMYKISSKSIFSLL
ncbi:aldolase catalytic domain-containing protein [Autumnicola psychrophila]|uniref:Aldolase catalytic domain-containing protein n=1 Tax=Autumnicola psychrophila TaxID=3075592 RepID=A0ABU3DS60_9FLAO|nr:aldolase catalytic domain-containing protein [Zunongwangia sp. F225]MDT0686552.1 aldolase catalytic domain-containing protein [Zunongwangia sp. F225]